MSNEGVEVKSNYCCRETPTSETVTSDCGPRKPSLELVPSPTVAGGWVSFGVLGRNHSVSRCQLEGKLAVLRSYIYKSDRQQNLAWATIVTRYHEKSHR